MLITTQISSYLAPITNGSACKSFISREDMHISLLQCKVIRKSSLISLLKIS